MTVRWVDGMRELAPRYEGFMLDLWGVGYVLDPARYGQLPNYRGVTFLGAQALLHSSAGGALAEEMDDDHGARPARDFFL